MSQSAPFDPVDSHEDPDSIEDAPGAAHGPLSQPSERGVLGRVMPRSLLGRQLLVIGVILGIGNALLLGNFRDYALDDVVASEQRRIQDLARIVASRLDASQHEAATASAPGRDAFVEWNRAPAEAQAQHAVLADFARTAELDSSTYTLRIKDDASEAIFAEPGRPHRDALEFVMTSATTPYWRHNYTYRPAMAPALIDGEVAVTGRYVDDQGEWVTAYAPLKNGAGEVVAIVSVDAPLALLFAPLAERQWRDARLLGFTFLATFLAVVLIVRRLGAGLRGIEEAAARIGGGDYATPVRAFGFAEVVSLARGLEGARRRVSGDMDRLEGLRRTLGRRLAEASEQVDALGRRRRERYADLVGELQVMVEVGARPLPAHLIDLTYDRLVVGMRKEIAPQLASGMVARVALETRGETSRCVYECTNDGSFEIDDMVHFAFKVQGGLRLEEVPKNVGNVLNERRALRISPNSDTALRVAVRRSQKVRPIAAEVVDLSSDGIKVILPIGHRQFSAWGVHLEVAIRFHQQDPALRLSGRVRNCRPTADGRVVVGVEFDADETPSFEKRQQTVAQWVMAEDRLQRESRERYVG